MTKEKNLSVLRARCLAAFDPHGKGATPVDGYELLAGKTESASPRGIFVLDGVFSRRHYQQAVREAAQAGVSTEDVYVMAHLCAYSGAAFTS